MRKILSDGIASLLVKHFQAGDLPTRKCLVEELIKATPKVNHPQIELEVAQALNKLVDRETLQRIQGKFYAPGERYFRG